TLLGARVAPQHCPIPLAGKNIYFSIVKNMVTKSFTQNNLHNHQVGLFAPVLGFIPLISGSFGRILIPQVHDFYSADIQLLKLIINPPYNRFII
ncbi:hypothetical protein MXL46_16980, partial [Heyndrickxia sporothermodurans]|uniref:hypothetical protein n=1 Tax=Heyndrickxia sporothermodurans TaxID=46224 RepID=UPI002DBCC819